MNKDDDPTIETPVTKPEPKAVEKDELPDEAVDTVVGGDVTMGQRGSNDRP